MLQRKRMNDLLTWKEKESTALLVDGARQVGKTFLIEAFAEEAFPRYFKIDFTKDARALSLLLEVTNYEDFKDRLVLLNPIAREDGFLLFLDEIQYYYEMREKRIQADPDFERKYVDILTLAKEIVSRAEFRLILSGSMLGVSLFRINLNPTGYVRPLTLFPLDFEEFLWADGFNAPMVERIHRAFLDKEPLDDALHTLLLSKFREYALVGGMPAAVEAYQRDKSFELVSSALDGVEVWYKDDIVKYAPKEDRLILLEMYRLLASEVSAKNKKFVKSHLDVPNFKNLDLKDRFLWLQSAGIAIPTYNVTNPVYPLRISEESKIMKLFFGDVGLLSHQLFDTEGLQSIRLGNEDVDLGAVYENAVAELLHAHGFEPRFHSNKKRGEVDFIIEKNQAIIPLEIKSGRAPRSSGIYAHAALDQLLSSHPEIHEAYVFGNGNIRKESEVLYSLPIYFVEFLR